MVDGTSGGTHRATFKYAEKVLKDTLSLYPVNNKEWNKFLKSSIESCISCVTGNGDPEKLGETLKEDVLALNNYAYYFCTDR